MLKKILFIFFLKVFEYGHLMSSQAELSRIEFDLLKLMIIESRQDSLVEELSKEPANLNVDYGDKSLLLYAVRCYEQNRLDINKLPLHKQHLGDKWLLSNKQLEIIKILVRFGAELKESEFKDSLDPEIYENAFGKVKLIRDYFPGDTVRFAKYLIRQEDDKK